MIFKAETGKKMRYHLRRPNQKGARRWLLATIGMFFVSLASISISSILAIICAALTLVCAIKSCCRFFLGGRYKEQLEINNKNITFSCLVKNEETGKKETFTVKMLKLDGIEYYTKTKQIAFLGLADYGFTKMYGFVTEDIYEGDLINYLKNKGMKVTYIQTGDFADKWRAD